MATVITVWKDFIAHAYGSESNKRLCLVFDGIDEALQGEIAEIVDLL